MRNQLTLCLSALTLCALAGTAAAQNTPGNGRILERDLRVGGTGNFPRTNFMQEVAARNALVTGNAPGGRSLHINPGYSAPNDFRGSLGSDQLFAFRRDSVASAPGYRGTQGLQYQSSFTTGNSVPNPFINRLDTFGASGDLPRTGYVPQNQPITGVPRALDNPYAATRADQVGSPSGTLRSTGAFTSITGLTPAVVGLQSPERGSGQITASSLLGIRFQQPGTKDERMTAREQADQLPTKRPNDASLRDTAPKGPNLSAVDTSFRTSYDDLRVRLDEQGRAMTASTPEKPEKPDAPRPSWEKRIDELRQQIEKERKEREQDQQPKKPASTTLGAGTGDAPGANPTRPDATRKALDDETMEIIKKAGGEVSAYTTGTPGSLFDSHMRAAEESMGKGRYFDAEERFARALAMRPGDATVMAARLNAQIGAGLYLSAAVNLKQLFQQHPEVMGTRYTGKAMPASRRTEALAGEFRELLSEARRSGQPIPEESALLLAYIGFQNEDSSAIKEGLDNLTSAANGTDETLIHSLRKVWLGKAPETK